MDLKHFRLVGRWTQWHW